jgi:hypothetical protein
VLKQGERAVRERDYFKITPKAREGALGISPGLAGVQFLPIFLQPRYAGGVLSSYASPAVFDFSPELIRFETTQLEPFPIIMHLRVNRVRAWVTGKSLCFSYRHGQSSATFNSCSGAVFQHQEFPILGGLISLLLL